MYKVGMWKKLVALSMIVILGVSAVTVSIIMTRHGSPNSMQQIVAKEQVVDMMHRSIADTIRGSMDEVVDKISSTERTVASYTQAEQQVNSLLEYYQSDEFFDELDDVLATGDLQQIWDFVFGELNEFLDENPEYALDVPMSRNGFFVGIYRSAQENRWLWDNIIGILGTALNAVDLGMQLWGIVMMSPAAGVAGAALASVLNVLRAVFAAIPVIGWVALGLLVVMEISIFVTMLVRGSQNRHFRVGVHVNTWWWIPTGVRWVAE